MPLVGQVVQVRTPAGPDSYEDDDSSALAAEIAVNAGAQLHSFHDIGDEDWAYFDALSGAVYTISTDNLDPFCDTVLMLYDTDGSTVLASTDEEFYGGAEVIEWLLSQHRSPR